MKRRRKQHHRKMKSIERKKVHFKVLFFRCCAQCKRGESIKKAAAKAISISRIACLYVLHNGQRDVIASRCGNLGSGKFSAAETSSRLMRRRCRREKGKGRAFHISATSSGGESETTVRTIIDELICRSVGGEGGEIDNCHFSRMLRCPTLSLSPGSPQRPLPLGFSTAPLTSSI